MEGSETKGRVVEAGDGVGEVAGEGGHAPVCVWVRVWVCVCVFN